MLMGHCCCMNDLPPPHGVKQTAWADPSGAGLAALGVRGHLQVIPGRAGKLTGLKGCCHVAVLGLGVGPPNLYGRPRPRGGGVGR